MSRRPFLMSLRVVLLGIGTISNVAIAGVLVPVSGRIVDDDSGQMIPGRLVIERSDGTTFFATSADPTGSAVIYDKARLPASFERHTTLSAHPFQTELPPGDYRITAWHGKEYISTSQRVTLEQQPVELVLQLKRWINMAERGWYSGDTHVHRSIAELPNIVQAEDLNVALPLSYWVRTGRTPPGQDPRSEPVAAKLMEVDPTHVIWPINTEYEIFTMEGKSHTLGAVFVLNHQSPLSPGAPPVGPIAAQARDQGAILDLDKHSWPWSLMIVPVMDVDLFELSNNHIWQTQFAFNKWTSGTLPAGWNIETDADGWTEWGWIDFGFKSYYALLNCGFRLRPTAGTASGVHPVPLGFGRVYVHLPQGFNYADWVQGLNAGRTFVSTGPMLVCEFNGLDHGSTITAPGPTRLVIRGTADSALPLARISIVKNGDVVRTVTPQNEPLPAGGYRTRIQESLEINSSGWVAVRCFESDPERRNRFAHTAPVHIDIAGQPVSPRRIEVEYFIQRMEQELASNKEVLSPDELAEYQRALDIYLKLREIARE